MSTLALRSAIVSAIDDGIPTLKTCQAHGGKFDLKELMRWAVQAPAVLVSVLGGNIQREGGANVIDLRVAAFIVTPGSSASHRDAAVLTIVDAIAALACNNAWDYSQASAPQNIKCENLYAGDIDQKGVALWAVTWTQNVDVGEIDASELDDLKTVWAQWDLAPADGILDAEDNIEPQGAFMSSQGNLHVSTAVPTAIAVIDTYQKLAGTTELDVATGVDMPTDGRLRYTGATTRPFFVEAAISMSVAADMKVTVAIAKNGTADEESEIEQNITIAQGVQVFPLSGLVSLATNEYVEVWVKSTVADTITATKMKLSIAAA
jgi:hypothetical protein